MAFMQLRSTNPEFSFVIGKNPASGLSCRPIRGGVGFGYYGGGAYNVYFRDADDEVSFKSSPGEKFEHVNVSRLASPLFPLAAITEFFSAAVKKPQPADVHGFTSEAVINMMTIQRTSIVEAFQTHMPEFYISLDPVSPLNYRVRFETERPLRELLACVTLFCLLSALRDGDDVFQRDDEPIEKYLSAVSVVDAPYFIRYLFKVLLLRGPTAFGRHKEALEKTSRHGRIELSFGNSQIARRDKVMELLERTQNHVLDIGCGEGFYASGISPRMAAGRMYLAVDRDEGARLAASRRASDKGLTNVSVGPSVEHFLSTLSQAAGRGEKVDVIIVEVVEHMETHEAENLVRMAASLPGAASVIVTTPNRLFNRHYAGPDADSGAMRHHDHKFELSPDEFTAFIARCLPEGTSASFFPIGDVVDGEASTLGVKIVAGTEAVTAARQEGGDASGPGQTSALGGL